MKGLFRAAVLLAALAGGISPLRAQTTEERLAELEQLVQELRALHDLPANPIPELPARLIGNEHVRWDTRAATARFSSRSTTSRATTNEHLVPDWVTYHLTRDNLEGDAARRNDCRPDPELVPGDRAELVDYRNSGFDRGHMAPAPPPDHGREAVS